ncbi:tetratricopeptide repeat protein [Sandaracinus amylolyticus]|uniref:tetratricopeptide repeat protein n=1 Tax=Sandaracinus amylolyticus TaxID=927083 RepID=UPI002E37419E|nr:tetratricopeptide repeat protein [Sandaracinus amylolyticus]
MTFAMVGCALALAISMPARAQQAEGVDDEARIHFELARRYYDTGRFLEAAHEFEAAFRLSPHDELLFNVYLAYRDAGEDAQALAALRRFVTALPEGSDRRVQLEARVQVMEARIAAEAQGRAAPEDDTPHEALLEAPVESTPEARPEASSGGLGVAPWVVVGVGGAVLAGALVTGLLALDERAALEARCPTRDTCEDGFEDGRARGEALAITTDVLWIAGAATAVTGVVLAIVDATSGSSEREDTPQVALACDVTGCGISATGSF